MIINSRQRGFTLIEALVALVILSFGLLGVAAMQLKALQSAHMGYQRAVVSLAAIDAQERAWAIMAQDSKKKCPIDTGLNGWKAHWNILLPIASHGSTQVQEVDACEYAVTIGWAEERFSDPDEQVVPFIYSFRLPQLD
ncbi:type IV pilus modification protein PilV [Marinobacter sp. TBZ242]|uniref:Type IV pilus modification protein PilV n=1 Tax=Marinobacter azerbaijanicus TaxID=3050455 RepID=A0ABT7IK31_9GAMM|nr:type IV pilus modification protein PilV [Marinobacter sp. TBZ242]MDL0434070.1 type IV pilus modification protein PilV [Marinobacter sp. TBZ242]